MDNGSKVNKAVKCDVCNLTLNSEQQAQQHYSGKNHLKKVRQIAPASTPQTPNVATTVSVPAPSAAPAPAAQRANQPQYGVTQTPAQGAESKLDPVAQAVYDNVLGNLPTKRKKEIPCHVCDQIFNSDAQARAHFVGTKHAKKQKVSEMREEGSLVADTDTTCTKKSWGLPFHCDLCNISVNSELQFQAHQNGEKHQNKVKAAAGAPFKPITATTNSSKWNEIPGNQPGWFYCTICNISVSTATALQQHIRTENHKMNMSTQKSQVSTQ